LPEHVDAPSLPSWSSAVSRGSVSGAHACQAAIASAAPGASRGRTRRAARGGRAARSACDAEVAAACAAQRPEQVAWWWASTRRSLPSGVTTVIGDHVVGGQAPGARREPVAAAEREPAEPDRRARAERDGAAVAGERVDDLDRVRAAPMRRARGAAVHGDPAQPPQVDHHALVERRVAGV
jgi:hypothetical protein